MNWSHFFSVVLITFWILIISRDIPKNIAIRSTHKRWKWLRRLYWGFIVNKFRAEKMTSYGFRDYKNEYKVHSYFMNYIRRSMAAKEYYLTNGYDALRQTMIGKLEEIEKFIDKYKYNTFENLSEDEIDFIKNFEKKKK